MLEIVLEKESKLPGTVSTCFAETDNEKNPRDYFIQSHVLLCTSNISVDQDYHAAL